MSTQKQHHFDTIIIGSGFGGAVAGNKLSARGESVLMLERGPWRDTQPVRALGISDRSPLPRGWLALTHTVRNLQLPLLPAIKLKAAGLFELFYNKDMSIVCSSGVGGGSHVYSALNVCPAEKNYWADIVGKNAAKKIEANYDWMIDKMGATTPTGDIENFVGKRWSDHPYLKADESVEQPAMSVRTESATDLQNNSFFGSQAGAKATLDQVLIAPALKQGMKLKAMTECISIRARQIDESQSGYRIVAYDHIEKRHHFYTCERLVLAAGTLNSLKLLFANQQKNNLLPMPALGRGFSGNGDVVSYWPVQDDFADYSRGTPCHGRFELKDYENCPDLTSYGLNGINELPLPKRLKARLRKDLIVVAMGADKADGIAQWKRGRLSIRFLLANSPVYQGIAKALTELGKRSGTPLISSVKTPLTVHPLGGARAAQYETQGVINLQGECHNNPGLYVVDGSALAAAPGAPPSMTIAAWSAYVCDHIK